MPFFSKCALLWTRFKLKFHFRRQFETVIHDIGHIDSSELYGIQQRFLVQPTSGKQPLAAVKYDAPASIRRFVVDACSRTIFFFMWHVINPWQILRWALSTTSAGPTCRWPWITVSYVCGRPFLLDKWLEGFFCLVVAVSLLSQSSDPVFQGNNTLHLPSSSSIVSLKCCIVEQQYQIWLHLPVAKMID